MNNGIKQAENKLNTTRTRRKWWQRLVSSMTAVVVFCTTYALILPALTLEGDPICGIEAHEHSDACYETHQVTGFQCGLDETTVTLHTHGGLCFDAEGNLICPLPEIAEHTHSESCYVETVTENLLCGNVHVHDESCTGMETVAVCGLAETEGHTHDAKCYTLHLDACTEEHIHDENCMRSESELVCTEPETPAHTHSESCWEQREKVCTLTTNDGHVHEDGCYEKVMTLGCGMLEVAPHIHGEGCESCTLVQAAYHDHSESCIAVNEVKTLVCQIPVHIHSDECYPVEEDAQNPYLCGSGVHAHVSECYDEAGNLTCTIPAHAHEAACLVADLDMTADVETAQQWVESLQGVELTGIWPEDVLALAATQLGYRESEKNVVLMGESLKGYTRYGDWYGDPYGDWCAMFASFLLSHAGVEDFPLESGCTRWIEALEERELYRIPAAYTPKPGDLIFFDHEQRAGMEIAVDADHVGVVAELIEATEETPAIIRTIEGNTANRVAYEEYDVDDPTIIGYGVLPAGPVTVLTAQGSDYLVTVKYRADARIPENAVLEVREILPGTEEYNTYYQQSVAAMLSSATVNTEEELAISFARFFDISFLVDGQVLEPAAQVDVQISYADYIPQAGTESGVAVHFAESGIEVLDAETSASAEEAAESIDTFQFAQGSFSVVGTVISAYQQAVATTATRVEPWEIDNTAATLYVLYTQIGGQYFALDGNGNPVQVSVSGNTVNLGTNASNDLFWTFKEAPGNYTYNPITNVGTGRYLHPFNNGGSNQGILTGSPYQSSLTVNGSTFKIRGNNQFVRFDNGYTAAKPVAQENQATSFYAASVGKLRNVWFDGTCGGMMSYYGADNLNIPALVDNNGVSTVTLPETWKGSTKYPYVLQGWYDIKNHTYYRVDPTDGKDVVAKLTADTVFYADWVAASYDVGEDNEHTVNSLDTNDFITTHVFDYNVLFNVMSQTHTGTISAANHSETWSIVNNGKVPYQDQNTLGFVFVDYDAGGDISYANGRDNNNTNRDTITPGLVQRTKNLSGKDLLDVLFNPETEVVGKYYAGTGNYLFQYMDSTMDNYDGIHDGYYYLDAQLNAASYNQTEQRFYLYNYLERTSDSAKDGGGGQYSDFLPFNSPYVFGESDDYTPGLNNANRRVDYYEDSIRRPGWEYDAKDGASSYQEYNTATDATTNYFFGIRTDIEFFLPNVAGSQDEYGNYGNISTRGEHMIFDFHGDDDVWVFIDDELVLDIGGVHGIMYGQIDFSTGTVISGKDGGETTTRTFQQILGHNISDGTHKMTVYYMERGSSQSNCAIYFNIAPRYDLEITKEDIFTAEELDGAGFTIYTCEACANGNCTDHGTPQLAQLWDSKAVHDEDMKDDLIDHAKSTFTVVDGVAKCWGISAGTTYYIKETKPPEGYPESDDLIRITLNNRGTATIETTILHGANGEATEGFAVIKQNVNDTLKIVALTVTNQRDGDTTEVRVMKEWAEGSTDMPESITVYLTADGVPVGRRAILTEANGWSYTWTGLPKYAAEGVDVEIVYEVQEVLVPDYITTQGENLKVEKYVDWIKVANMSDSETYILVHNGQALTYNGSFGWMDPAAAEADTALAAQWSVTTDHDGFHLKNGLGYTLTFNPDTDRFYGVDNDEASLNQVFYYLNSRLVVHDHDVYYQFGTNGTAVASDGLAFTLYQKEVLTGFLTQIINVPVQEQDQTFVEVNKVWKDGNDLHADDSVIIRLFADGKDTGRFVTLNAAGGWKGGFYDLPYFQEDGTTVVQYTVVEDPFGNYKPDYSDPSTLTGLPVTLWSDAGSLTANDIYRFFSGNYAMAVDTKNDNKVTTKLANPTDLNQQWKAVSYGGGIVLQNVGTNLYLAHSGNSLSVTNSATGAARVTITGGLVTLGSSGGQTYYLELNASGAGATTNSGNISGQRVAVKTETTTRPGTGYTVTNAIGYTLPNTGSAGLPSFTFGGLLILAAALMYILEFGRKRQKGGSDQRE